jgi:phosphohistidine phosphatase
MIVYFLRHGLAEERDTWKEDDSLRPLTDKGKLQLGRTADAISKVVPDLDAIITSPLVRAKQTANIVAQKLDMEESLVEDARLSPGFGLEELGEIIKEQSGAEGLILVGHEPDFSSVVSQLIGGGRLVFKKGALARVDLIALNPPQGELVWLIPPKVLIR